MTKHGNSFNVYPNRPPVGRKAVGKSTNHRNFNAAPKQKSQYRPRGGRPVTTRRNRQSDNRSNTVPPSSLTQGSVGRSTREVITVRQLFGAADIAKYSEVQQVWVGAISPKTNCVTRIYYNKSNIAVDMTTPAAPKAVDSKKTITRLSGLKAQGHSTIAQFILASGDKIFDEASVMQRNVNVRQVENRPKVDLIKTKEMPLSPRARMVGKKGLKIYEMTLPQFPNLKFNYALANDTLTATGEHDRTTGYLGCVDTTIGIHSVPNATYEPSEQTVEPPDVILERSNDPMAVMKGYVPAVGETSIRIAASKEVHLRSVATGKYTATTNLDNLVPKPKPGTLYNIKNPFKVVKSANEITPMTVAHVEPAGNRVAFYESTEAFQDGCNKGSVTDATLTILPGTYFLPTRIPPTPATHHFLNGFNQLYKPGDRVLQIIQKNTRSAKEMKNSGAELDDERFEVPSSYQHYQDSEGEDSEASMLMETMSLKEKKMKMDKYNRAKMKY